MTKLIHLCIALALAAAAAAQADIPIITADDLMDAFQENAAERIEEALKDDAEGNAWTPPDPSFWEDAMRTSDWDAVISNFPEGRRIGCICMDGTPREDKGTGACAGYGGVRFWLYQNGDTILMHPTDRHHRHPFPYTEEDRQNLAAYNRKEGTALGSSRNTFGGDFANIAMVLMVCITISYIARIYFTHGSD